MSVEIPDTDQPTGTAEEQPVVQPTGSDQEVVTAEDSISRASVQSLDFEKEYYKAQAAQFRAEKETLAAKLELAEAKAKRAAEEGQGVAGNGVGTGGPHQRRQRELEWDKLSYIAVGEFSGNPHLAPDPRVGLANPDRPQPFSLYGCKISDSFEATKSGLRFEYAILAPLLYYFWGLLQFNREILLPGATNMR